MTAPAITPPDALDDLRRATLLGLLALSREHDLRMPREISTTPALKDVGPCLRLSFERDVDVDGWAAALGAEPRDDESEYGRTRAFSLVGVDVPVWLGWEQVHGRCYPFHREPTTVLAALPGEDRDVMQVTP